MLKTMCQKWNITRNSIRFKLTAGMILFLLPICAYLYYSNVYSAGVLRDQAARTNKKAVSLYMQVVDKDLGNVSVYLAGLVTSNSWLDGMDDPGDPNLRELAKNNVYAAITNDITQYPSIDAIFVYAANHRTYIAACRSDSYTETEKLAIQNHIIASLSDQSNIGGHYFAASIAGKYYLLKIFRRDSLYVGTWISTESLLSQINEINASDQSVALFTTQAGVPMNQEAFVHGSGVSFRGDFSEYYISGKKSRYLVVGEKSTAGDFCLVNLIPEQKLLANLLFLRYIGYGLIALSFLVIPVYLFFMNKTVLIPLFKIYLTIQKVNDGDLNARIGRFQSSFEFTELRDTFNNMMDEIKGLKISIYEEKLSKQEEELENLRLQINPHFIMNSLHIIYSLAQVKDYALVQEMSLCLSKYFGFLTRGNRKVVLLGEELEQLKNYIRINELRFPDCFTCEIDVPGELLSVPVPVLILQTLVENSFKYALNTDDPIRIRIRARRLEDGPRLQLSVSNTGSWYEPVVLALLRSGKRIVKKDGLHIGIWNLRRRLELLYADKASISFENLNPKGVETRIILPL